MSLINGVPDDIWKDIFAFSMRDRTERRTKVEPGKDDRILCGFSMVSKYWMKMIRDFVRCWFRNSKTTSNWVLSQFSDVEVLHDSFNTINDRTMSLLTNLKDLRLVCNDRITPQGIQNLTNLTKLDLSFNTSITDACLQKLVNLKSIYLAWNYTISDEGFNNMKDLELLDLRSTKITNKGFKNLVNLNSLSMNYHENFSVKAIEKLQKLTRLIDLGGNIPVKSLSNLRALSIIHSYSIGYDGVSNLKDLSSLKSKHIFDDDLKLMTNLTTLRIPSNENLTDSCIRNLTQLSTLNISNTKISDAGIQDLTLLTDLTTSQNISDESIKNLTQLTRLDLNNSGHLISDYGIHNLSNLKIFFNSTHSKISKNALEKLTLHNQEPKFNKTY